MDPAKGRYKAMKVGKVIERYLKDSEKKWSDIRILETGVGSGETTKWFALQGANAYGVDVEDKRLDKDKWSFTLVKNEILPFPDNNFDFVISKHVIEHVSNPSLHLQEAIRVLKHNGLGYLSTPNRWTIFEPHTKVPFLSMLPLSLRSPYFRLHNKKEPNEIFDVNPLSRKDCHRLFKDNNISFNEHTLQTMRDIASIEPMGWFNKLILKSPKLLFYVALRAIIPTITFLFKKGL